MLLLLLYRKEFQIYWRYTKGIRRSRHICQKRHWNNQKTCWDTKQHKFQSAWKRACLGWTWILCASDWQCNRFGHNWWSYSGDKTYEFYRPKFGKTGNLCTGIGNTKVTYPLTTMSLFFILVINVMVGPRNRVKQQLLTFRAIWSMLSWHGGRMATYNIIL